MHEKSSQVTHLNEVSCLLTTTSGLEEARLIAKSLLEARLVACVQIDGPIESHYRWEGKIETAQEWRIVAKTTGDAVGKVRDHVHAMHSYDEPQILFFPFSEGSPGYLAWVREEVICRSSD